MKIIALFFISILSLIFFSCSTGATEDEKENAWNSYFEGEYQLSDTLMKYSLSVDSLIIEFVKPTELKTWRGTIEIYDSNGARIFDTDFNNDGRLDTLNFHQGKLVLTGLNLNPDLLDQYEITLYGGPHFNNKDIIAVPMYNINNLYIEKTSGILSPRPNLSNTKFYIFNEQAFDSLSTELKEYCRLKKLEYYNKAVGASKL